MLNYIVGSLILIVMTVFTIGSAILASEEKELRRQWQRGEFDDQ